MNRHTLRPGDRVRLLPGDTWDHPASPKAGDLGTFVGGNGGHRVVYDPPRTHTRVNLTGSPGVMFNGKQSWGTNTVRLHYLGWRVNPAKV
jgi:hypothetical protein